MFCPFVKPSECFIIKKCRDEISLFSNQEFGNFTKLFPTKRMHKRHVLSEISVSVRQHGSLQAADYSGGQQ
jgi:hypothetical protein